MKWELFWIALYVLVMLIKGVWISRKIKTQDDYFLAGRSLGPWLTTFSIFATWFGAEACIGTAGSVYSSGLSSIHADPFGYAICLLLLGLVFSKVLWRKNITTIPDLFRDRFSPGIEKLMAILLVPASIIWAAAQIRALGQIVHANTSYSVEIATIGAAVVVVLYTMLGGLLADAYNDLIQGIAVVIGVGVMFIGLVMDLGGIEASLNAIPMEKLTFVSDETRSLGFLGNLELWLVPIFGSLMAQELVSRVLASRSEKVAYQSSLRAAAMYLVVGLIPVFIGLVGSIYYPNLAEPEGLMPMLARTHFSQFFYIIFMGALVSAILSTVDTTLLSASALMSTNVVNPLFKGLADSKRVLVARMLTLFSGICAFLIAFTSVSITGLVELASSAGGPIVFVLVLIALWVKKGGKYNALVSIILSVICWFTFKFIFPLDYPVLLTMLTAIIGYFGSMLFIKEEKFSSEELQISKSSTESMI